MAKNNSRVAFDEIKILLAAYIDGKWDQLYFYASKDKQDDLSTNDSDAEKYAPIILSLLVHYFQNIDREPNNRIGHLLEMAPLMQKQRNEVKEFRRNALRKEIQLNASTRVRSWKNLVLGIERLEESGSYFTSLAYDNNFEQPVNFSGRFFKKICNHTNSEVHNIVSITGSNFVTSNPSKQYKGKSQVLDATYIMLGNGIIVGSVADGCGGHLRIVPSYYQNTNLTDEEKRVRMEKENEAFKNEDKNIARAAHFATKYCCRFFSVYPDATSLSKNILPLVDLVASEISRKTQGERTTLLCVRAFHEKDNFRIVGFNIGDTALLAFTPETKTFSTLLPARVTVSDSGQEATAQIPDQYKHKNEGFYEIVQVNQVVSRGTIIFPISDGYLDYLPVIEEFKTYPNQLQYRETKVDSEKLEELFANFSEDITAERCADVLTEYVIDQTNQARKNMVEKQESGPDTQKGDDMALLAIPLLENPNSDNPHEINSNSCNLL